MKYEIDYNSYQSVDPTFTNNPYLVRNRRAPFNESNEFTDIPYQNTEAPNGQVKINNFNPIQGGISNEDVLGAQYKTDTLRMQEDNLGANVLINHANAAAAGKYSTSNPNSESFISDDFKNQTAGGLSALTNSNVDYSAANSDSIMVGVYNAYRKTGMSHNQAKIMVGEAGRETSMNPKTVFGYHIDPAKDNNGGNIKNMGFLSWNNERGKALDSFLKSRNLITKDGTMVKSQAALDAMAEFSVQEMQSKYSNKMENFLSNPNVDYETGAYEVGKHYVGWAIGQDTIKQGKGRRIAFDQKSAINNRNTWSNKIDKVVFYDNNRNKGIS